MSNGDTAPRSVRHPVLSSAVAAALLMSGWAGHAAFAQDEQPTQQSYTYSYPEMDPARHEDLRPFHDIVSTWLDKDGKSCCDERDCRIVEDYVVGTNAATGEEEYSVFVFGRWWKVPREAVRPYSSVTLGVIACYYWVWETDGRPRPEFRCVIGPHNS